MRKNSLFTVILLVFIGGIAAGYSLNHWLDALEASSVEDSSGQNEGGKPGDNSNQPPQTITISSTEMLQTVLPNLSPAWTSIHFNQLREHADRFQDVLALDSIQTILQDISSVLPHGATETIQFLYEKADTLEIFVLPPEPNQPAQRFAAAFAFQDSIEDATENEQMTHPLFAYWKTAFPELEISENTNGKMTFISAHTPIGEFTGLAAEGVAWFSNHTTGFPAMFTAPIQDTKEPPVNPRDEIKQRYPNTAIAIHLNGAHEGASALALPGIIPQLLTQYGIQEAVLAYQMQPNGVQLSVHAPSAMIPEWTKTWTSFSTFPFTAEDPMGLLEIAFHVPVMNATGAVDVSSASGEAKENNPPDQMQQPPMPPLHFGMSSSMLGLFPQGSVSGLNVFGFYQGQPSLAMRFAEMNNAPEWFKMLQTMPNVTASDVEIQRIPAKHYQFSDSPFAKLLGRNDLVMMERDAVTYLFDSPTAGKNYFGEINSDPVGKSRRNIKIRDGLQFVEEQAQIKGVLTKDWFEQWLLMEAHRYKQNPKLHHDLKKIAKDLEPLITPVFFSAGIREQEWFLDSHAPTAGGHLVDMFLLSSMLRSFLPSH